MDSAFHQHFSTPSLLDFKHIRSIRLDDINCSADNHWYDYIHQFSRNCKDSVWPVSFMAICYLIFVLLTVCIHIDVLSSVFEQIFTGAFAMRAGPGGHLRSTTLVGGKRGLFSNEAEDDSISMISFSANVSHPTKQGFVQLIGVFVDTLVICTATDL